MHDALSAISVLSGDIEVSRIERIGPKPKKGGTSFVLAPRHLTAKIKPASTLPGVAARLALTLEHRGYRLLAELIAGQEQTSKDYDRLWTIRDITDAFEEIMELELANMDLTTRALENDTMVIKLASLGWTDGQAAQPSTFGE